MARDFEWMQQRYGRGRRVDSHDSFPVVFILGNGDASGQSYRALSTCMNPERPRFAFSRNRVRAASSILVTADETSALGL